MNEDWEKTLIEKLNGCNFTVDDDPDNEGFFSVYANKDGSGVELAGKIGERCVAEALVGCLRLYCPS